MPAQPSASLSAILGDARDFSQPCRVTRMATKGKQQIAGPIPRRAAAMSAAEQAVDTDLARPGARHGRHRRSKVQQLPR